MADTTLVPENLTSNLTEEQEPDLPGIKILKLCIYFLILAVGLIGNGLVIFVTGYKMKMTVNSIWFLNLAIADFMFSLVMIVHIILHLSGEVLFITTFMTVFTMFASIFFLTVISLDRCMCTWFIVWAQNNRTLVKARIICVIVWIISICCSIPYITKKPGDIDENIQIFKNLITFVFLMGFLIPFLIIASSYIAIGVRVKQLKGVNKLRSLRVIICVILAFFICWLPYHVYQFCYTSALENHWSTSAQEVLDNLEPFIDWLVCLNSCLNPILYVFMCDEYKKKLKQSLLLVLEGAFTEEYLGLPTSLNSTSSHLSGLQSQQQTNDTIVSSASNRDSKTTH